MIKLGQQNIKCCKDCKPPERFAFCHSYCKLYMAEKEQLEIDRDIRMNIKAKERDIASLQYNKGKRCSSATVHSGVNGSR